MSAQWAVFPGGTTPAESASRPRGHRVDPDREAHTFCGAPIGEATRIDGRLPGGIQLCQPCRSTVTRRRRAAKAEHEKKLQAKRLQRVKVFVDRIANPIIGMTSPAAAEAADRAGRRRERGTSVRAMGAGLPSLGRDHR